MKLNTLEKLLHDHLKDLHSAEAQLARALPKLAKGATSDTLRRAFESHLRQTREQLERLDQIGAALGLKLTGKKCKAMEGLLDEGKEVLDADGDPAVLDAALIAAAQKAEHYEIAVYGTARALAERLGHADAARLLRQTLEEEAATDKKLTTIAVEEVYPCLLGDGGAKVGGARDDDAELNRPSAAAETEEAPAMGRG
jgi:ferritin-like metal-binding protein YciE